MHRKPIPVRALCAITKAVIERDPFLSNFDWCEDIKRELLRQGWDYPERCDAIHDAMRRVERALTKRWGPRPARPHLRRKDTRRETVTTP